MNYKTLAKNTAKCTVGLVGATLGAGLAYVWGNEALNTINDIYTQGQSYANFHLAGNIGNSLVGTVLTLGSLKVIKDTFKKKSLEKELKGGQNEKQN
ncbi:MAG: hypothetical protein ABFQ65_02855 [Nanoarchaeota archaeon]